MTHRHPAKGCSVKPESPRPWKTYQNHVLQISGQRQEIQRPAASGFHVSESHTQRNSESGPPGPVTNQGLTPFYMEFQFQG